MSLVIEGETQLTGELGVKRFYPDVVFVITCCACKKRTRIEEPMFYCPTMNQKEAIQIYCDCGVLNSEYVVLEVNLRAVRAMKKKVKKKKAKTKKRRN